jgi:hypothetical protein
MNIEDKIKNFERVKDVCQRTGYLAHKGECLAKDEIPCSYKNTQENSSIVYCSKHQYDPEKEEGEGE